ncbi:MAG: OmpH family outer membrane protein [Nitrosospira sp.]|nr:OmpH family outer membrane protein [Nitrosospira sp.]
MISLGTTCNVFSFNSGSSSKSIEQSGDLILKHDALWRGTLTAAACIIFTSGWDPGNALADDIKIGVVDTERILAESAPAVRALKKIEKEFLPRDQEIKKMALQAKALQDLLEKENQSMPEAERRDKERELATLNREIQRAQRQMREDLSLRQNDEVATLQLTATDAIQVIAETEKYDLILPLRDLVYRSPRIDITEKVIRALADK